MWALASNSHKAEQVEANQGCRSTPQPAWPLSSWPPAPGHCWRLGPGDNGSRSLSILPLSSNVQRNHGLDRLFPQARPRLPRPGCGTRSGVDGGWALGSPGSLPYSPDPPFASPGLGLQWGKWAQAAGAGSRVARPTRSADVHGVFATRLRGRRRLRLSRLPTGAQLVTHRAGSVCVCTYVPVCLCLSVYVSVCRCVSAHVSVGA